MPSKLRVGDDAKIFTVKDFNAVNEFHAPWNTWSWIKLPQHVSNNFSAMLLRWPLVAIASYLKFQYLVCMSWQRGSSLFTQSKESNDGGKYALQFDNWSWVSHAFPLQGCITTSIHSSCNYSHACVPVKAIKAIKAIDSRQDTLAIGLSLFKLLFLAQPRNWEQKRAELDEDPQQQYELHFAICMTVVSQ